MFSFLSLLVLPCLIRAHSWLECAKYGNPSVEAPLNGKSYDINKCQGFPRNMEATFGPKARHVFGIDRGFNVQPGSAFCNNRPQNGYTADYPMASYSPNEKVRLVWPAKNHDAEVCTNPFIPDTAMKIYVTEQKSGQVNGPGTLGNANTNPANGWMLLADFKASQIGGKPTPEGFQRCPDFCGARGTDKAICFQDMIISSQLAVGKTYTFLWYWIFNQGSGAYTTCWDATIVSGGNNPPPPTTTTTTTTTPRPTPQGAPPTTTTTTTARPTTQSGGGGGGNAAEQSVRVQIDNTAGTFDETGLKTVISRQLNIAACKVVTNTFSGSTQNGQATFIAIFFVNVPTGLVGSTSAQIQAPAFLNAVSAVTGGSNTIANPISDVAAQDSCSSGGATTAISRFTISLQITVATNPGAAFAGPLAIGIDDALLRNTPSITADVSCVVDPQQSNTYNCAIIVFNVGDVIAASNLANSQMFKTAIAQNVPASAGGQSLSAASLTVSNVPMNAGDSGTTQGPQVAGSMRLSGVFALVASVVVGYFVL